MRMFVGFSWAAIYNLSKSSHQFILVDYYSTEHRWVFFSGSSPASVSPRTNDSRADSTVKPLFESRLWFYTSYISGAVTYNMKESGTFRREQCLTDQVPGEGCSSRVVPKHGVSVSSCRTKYSPHDDLDRADNILDPGDHLLSSFRWRLQLRGLSGVATRLDLFPGIPQIWPGCRSGSSSCRWSPSDVHGHNDICHAALPRDRQRSLS